MQSPPSEKSSTIESTSMIIEEVISFTEDEITLRVRVKGGRLAPDVVQKVVNTALNNITPDNFETISNQIIHVASQSKNESDGQTLRQIVRLIFEKACNEEHWVSIAAELCAKMLATMSPDICDKTIKDSSGNPVSGGALFRKVLLNRCQEDFERGANVILSKTFDEQLAKADASSKEYNNVAAADDGAKRRYLCLIQFMGQLYKHGMLTLRIIHECVLRLLNFEGVPDEAAVENLVVLLQAVGPTMDKEPYQGINFMNAYFQRMQEIIFFKGDRVASKSKLLVMGVMSLRKAGWTWNGDCFKFLS